MDEQVSELKEEEKTTSSRRGRSRSSNQWIFGLILILIGLAFLLGNIFPFRFFNNWWAFFILFPAAVSLNRAWQSYREHGRLTSKGRSSLIGGMLIGTVGIIFLFSLNWGVVWPIFIIIIGLGVLLDNRAG